MAGEKAAGSFPLRLRDVAPRGEPEQLNLLGGGAVGRLNGDFIFGGIDSGSKIGGWGWERLGDGSVRTKNTSEWLPVGKLCARFTVGSQLKETQSSLLS